MRAIQIDSTGGPEVLIPVEVADPTAADGQLVVQVAAAGVNFIDTYHRTGLYAMELPFVPGLEGAGTVTEIGPGVEGWEIGDQAAWTAVIGSYASKLAIDASVAVKVPTGVSTDIAAAVMLQGLTAHYLVTSTWPLQPGQRCLVHAGAGGVGLLLIQMAKRLGAEVFTTVGTSEKAELAAGAGADHVVLYRDVDFVGAIRDITGQDHPLDVGYDGVGQTTFKPSLQLLRSRGLMATFGNASGPVEPISPIDMASGRSLIVTRPSLFHFIDGPGELQSRADDLFSWIAAGELDVRIGLEMPLDEAADAHRKLEGRQTTGKVLLRP